MPPSPHASSAPSADAAGRASPEAWLSVRPGDSPGRRRAALALMEGAALGRTARVLHPPGGCGAAGGGPGSDDSILFGGAAEAVAAAEAALLPLFGPGAVSRLAGPPEAAKAFAVGGSAPAPLGAPASVATSGEPFEARVAATPLDAALARRPVVGVSASGQPRAAGLRLSVRADALTRLSGDGAVTPGHGVAPAASRPHLARHASALLLRRAAEALLGDAEARAALLGASASLPLHLDWPPVAFDGATGWVSTPLPADDDRPPLLPVLPLGAVLAGAAAEAAAAGVPYGVAVPDAAALGWLADPAALPGAVVHLSWDAALAAAPQDVVTRLGPGRVVLEGADADEALAWGLSRGIGRYVGAAASRLLAAVRRRACAHGAGCGAAACAARAEGLSPAARAGCAVPARLLGEGLA